MPDRSDPPDTDDNYIVKPVFKALELLKSVGAAGRPVHLAEASAVSGLPKSTTFKYLRTLIRTGFVSYDSVRDTYRVGPQVRRLAEVPDDTEAIRRAAQPWMQDLRGTFNETVNLGVLDGVDVVYVDIVQSTHTLRLLAALGGHYPAYTTGLGKAIMAFLVDDEWRAHLPQRMNAITSTTITDPEALKTELDAIRACGYAMDHGESDEHVTCVAAPIFDRDGTVIAALSVAGPTIRMEPAVPDVTAAVLAATEKITAELSGS